jgi:uncharacterized protein (TIRG00374 family)
MRIGDKDYRVKPGLTIFLAISIVSALAIFYLAGDKGSWRSLRHIRPEYAALAALLMVAQWCFNAIRFKILVNSLGSNVSFVTSLKAFMTNVFAAAITPSQTGGGAMQVYVLNRAGVPIARGFTGCLMGALLTVFCLLTLTVAILLFRPGLRAEFGQRLAGVLVAVVAVLGLLIVMFLVSVLKTALMKRMIGWVLLVLTGFLKTEKRLALTKRVLGGVDHYRECLAVFVGHKRRRLLLGLVFTAMAIATNALIAPALLAGLNIEFDFLNVYVAQFILLFIAYFGPTPGASGIAEFSNYWVLSSLNVQSDVLGIYTVLWRFFTSFIGVGVGGLIVLSLITRRKAAGEQTGHVAASTDNR